jgi:hypothetical protein
VDVDVVLVVLVVEVVLVVLVVGVVLVLVALVATVVVLSPPQAAMPAAAPTPRAIAVAIAASRFIALLPVAFRAAEGTRASGVRLSRRARLASRRR